LCSELQQIFSFFEVASRPFFLEKVVFYTSFVSFYLYFFSLFHKNEKDLAVLDFPASYQEYALTQVVTASQLQKYFLFSKLKNFHSKTFTWFTAPRSGLVG